MAVEIKEFLDAKPATPGLRKLPMAPDLGRSVKVVGEVTPVDPPGLFETANARAKEGLPPEQRAGALAEVQRLHDVAVASMESVDEADWHRKAPVHYGPGTDPFPSSPSDIAGWLIDHYLEHVPHVNQLLADWRTSRP